MELDVWARRFLYLKKKLPPFRCQYLFYGKVDDIRKYREPLTARSKQIEGHDVPPIRCLASKLISGVTYDSLIWRHPKWIALAIAFHD